MWHSLLTADFLGNRHWVLTKPLSYEIFDFIDDSYLKIWQGIGASMVLHKHDYSLLITVPKGYHTDLASIARPMWVAISPWDVARAAVVHDMLYGLIRAHKAHLSKTRITALRDQADKIFRQGMRDADPEVATWRIGICYYFVRSLGWASIIKEPKFNANKKTNKR